MAFAACIDARWSRTKRCHELAVNAPLTAHSKPGWHRDRAVRVSGRAEAMEVAMGETLLCVGLLLLGLSVTAAGILVAFYG